MIAERPEGEKAQDPPALRKVPQTLAAGWGGVGAVQVAMMSSVAMAEACSVADYLDMPAFLCSNEAVTHRAPGPDIPEPYRRLLVLIEDSLDRLDARHAIDLLREAGLISEFDELFRNASDLGLNVDVIAVIVLARLLGDPLGEFLSPETQDAVASLQDHARQVTEDIREMGSHGMALVQVIAGCAGRDILRPDPAHAFEETLQRVARFSDLLDQIQV